MSTSFLNVLIYILTYWSIVFTAVYVLFVIIKSIYKDKIKISYRTLHISFLISLFAYMIIATYSQYELWNNSPFTKILSEVPVKEGTPFPGLIALFKPLFSIKHGYLFHYSFTHFASPILFGLIVSAIFVGLVKVFARFRPYLVDTDELNVIIAGSLAFAWPYSMFFVIVLFCLFLAHNIYNSFRGRERTQILPSAVCSIIVMYIIVNFVDQFPVIFKSLYTVMPG